MQKITQTNINNVYDCLRKNCTSNGHDFSQHLGFNSDYSYIFDVCNKKGKVICLAFFADEVIEVLNNNGFEITSQVSECPSNTNYKMFLFKAKKEEDESVDPEIKTFITENNIEILKEEPGYIELRPNSYLLTDKITKLMYKHQYDRTKREYVDKITTLGFTKITTPAEILFCKIDNDVIENFKNEVNYVDIEDYNDTTLEICYSVNGGYERDVNAYYGGSEYVDELVENLETYPEINSVKSTLDEEDLTGYITIEYDVAKI